MSAAPELERGIGGLATRIRGLRQRVPPDRAVLVAISGIDACGKGHVAERLRAMLAAGGLRVAVIGVDGWLALPAVRFAAGEPGPHFYRHALRFDALFTDVVLPLQRRRSVHVEVDHADETATAFRRRSVRFDDVDVVLLEGIFLLQRAFQDGRYDLAVWIDCSFATALARAVARAQEGLPPAATVHAYETIYFAAQRLHQARDDPRGAADVILANDG